MVNAIRPRRSGILTGLFSVFSGRSIGTGDFSDLETLIDWCAATGNSVLHLLPLNEMGRSFSPYEPFSGFALEPMYMSLDAFSGPAWLSQRLDELRTAFPAGQPHFDPAFKEKKFNLLWDIYVHESEQGILDRKALADFHEHNISWLDDFALFKVLGDFHGKRPWYKWQEEYRDRDSGAIEKFRKEHEYELFFDYWVQMHLFRQLQSCARRAAQKGVELKGDLALLIPRDSADVWSRQGQFRLGMDAGTAPDARNPAGIRHDAPVWDWGKMAEDGYSYLRQRLSYLGRTYGLLRIVNARELAGSWAVPVSEPPECAAAHGFFLPEDQKERERQADKLLAVIRENSACVFSVPGTEAQELESALKNAGIALEHLHRQQKTDGIFVKPDDYDEATVSGLSDQDTCDWGTWWEAEADTVDKDLFSRTCADTGLDERRVRQLLCRGRSADSRLRWKGDVPVERIEKATGRKNEELGPLLDLYLSGRGEKELVWRSLANGSCPQEAAPSLVKEAIGMTLYSRSRYAMNTLFDWIRALGLAGEKKSFRMNEPGTKKARNWSCVLPVPLEALMEPGVTRLASRMITAARREHAPQRKIAERI
ncbi:MAG: 4-alpha-glucanotransferase [Deltaproteobacteria bacterium]